MSDSYVLKITSGAEIAESLDPSKEVIIKNAECTIYEVAKHDNDDGSFEIRYKARITSPVELEQSGKAIRGSDKKGKSKKLRGAIWYLANEEEVDDKDLFYGMVMDKLICNIGEIWQMYKNK
jgi:hypothetical protein